MAEPVILLKPGREKSVLNRHPWIFASAIERINGEPQLGDPVRVLTSKNEQVAVAAYSPNSQIRARIWTLDVEQRINKEFLKKRILESIERREHLRKTENTNAFRLIYGEADGLPGLIVDQFDQTLVLQILSAGPEKYRSDLIDLLDELIAPDEIVERSDVDVRALEGLDERQIIIKGGDLGGTTIIQENGLKYKVDVRTGQKTGFYIDQRRNRQKVFELAEGRDVLNCFCYTGGFTLNALTGGARSVLSVDSSAPALVQMQQNLVLNRLDEEKSQLMEGDVFKLLRLFRDKAKSFDLIILDPPKFAPTVSQAEKASRAYKDINLLAIKLLRPGGILVTFSCSGGISRDLFQKIVAGAALDAGADLRIIDQLSQSPDHPVLMSFPESLYLKGLICKK